MARLLPARSSSSSGEASHQQATPGRFVRLVEARPRPSSVARSHPRACIVRVLHDRLPSSTKTASQPAARGPAAEAGSIADALKRKLREGSSRGAMLMSELTPLHTPILASDGRRTHSASDELPVRIAADSSGCRPIGWTECCRVCERSTRRRGRQPSRRPWSEGLQRNLGGQQESWGRAFWLVGSHGRYSADGRATFGWRLSSRADVLARRRAEGRGRADGAKAISPQPHLPPDGSEPCSPPCGPGLSFRRPEALSRERLLRAGHGRRARLAAGSEIERLGTRECRARNGRGADKRGPACAGQGTSGRTRPVRQALGKAGRKEGVTRVPSAAAGARTGSTRASSRSGRPRGRQRCRARRASGEGFGPGGWEGSTRARMSRDEDGLSVRQSSTAARRCPRRVVRVEAVRAGWASTVAEDGPQALRPSSAGCGHDPRAPGRPAVVVVRLSSVRRAAGAGRAPQTAPARPVRQQNSRAVWTTEEASAAGAGQRCQGS